MKVIKLYNMMGSVFKRIERVSKWVVGVGNMYVTVYVDGRDSPDIIFSTSFLWTVEESVE